MIRLIAFLLVLVTAPTFGLDGQKSAGNIIAIPGTGIHLIPPPGMKNDAAGTYLIDDNGETIMFFMMDDTKHSLDNDAMYRALYKKPPEKISTSAFSGNLYRRIGATDGGNWDGWLLVVSRGQKTLTVTTTYSGKSREAFDRIREALLTLTWDESAADPELALGVKLAPPGLQVVKGSFGSLLYNKSGRAGGAGPELMLMPLPLPLSKTQDIFPKGCVTLLGAAFKREEFIGPRMHEYNGVSVCDGWSKTQESDMRYIALIRLPSGAVLNATGTASSDRFQDSLPIFQSAVANLQVYTRQSK
jgi:hypothetical protein